MKKLLLLLSLILVSCSGGISEKSLFGEWITEKGDLIIMNKNVLIMDGNENKYSIDDINQDLGVIKLSSVTYEGMPVDIQFVVKDENNLKATFLGFMTEDLIRLPDSSEWSEILSEISIFDEVPENFLNYWSKIEEEDELANLWNLYMFDKSTELLYNDEFVDNFKKENPAFNLNSTYLDVKQIRLKNLSYEDLKKEDAELAALYLFLDSIGF